MGPVTEGGGGFGGSGGGPDVSNMYKNSACTCPGTLGTGAPAGATRTTSFERVVTR